MPADQSPKQTMKAGMMLKPKHGEVNPVFLNEERSMIAEVDKALQTENAQIIGANGEIPLRGFLTRYLPSMFKVATGKFITPSGTLSPQIDIMLLDSRYPLLSHHADGSVTAMMHSVICTVEVKVSINRREMLGIKKHHDTIFQPNSEQFPRYIYGSILSHAFCYRSSLQDQKLAEHFYSCQSPMADIHLLRSKKHTEQ